MKMNSGLQQREILSVENQSKGHILGSVLQNKTTLAPYRPIHFCRSRNVIIKNIFLQPQTVFVPLQNKNVLIAF